MKFDFKNYKGSYVMHCKTLKEAEEFCELMHESGRVWCSNNSYVHNEQWEIHKEETCYNFNEGSFADVQCYEGMNYKIIEWSDFFKLTEFDFNKYKGNYKPGRAL